MAEEETEEVSEISKEISKLETFLLVYGWLEEKGDVFRSLASKAIEIDEEVAEFAELCEEKPKKASKKLVKLGKQLLKLYKKRSGQ